MSVPDSEDSRQLLISDTASDGLNYRTIQETDRITSPIRSPRSSSTFRSRRRVQSDDNSEEDYVSIELPSLGNIGDDNAIATALHKCKKQVLEPYGFLLKLLGWSPWMSDEAVPYCGEAFVWLINILYPGLVIIILLLGYILQFACCLSRTKPFYSLPPGTEIPSNCSVERHKHLKLCDNPTSTYLWLDILHLLSYAYAFYVFRWCRNEELETVTTKTFLQTATDRQRGFLSQGTLTRQIRTILVLGIVWLIGQLCVNIVVILTRILDCRITESGKVGFSDWIAAGGELTIAEMYTLIVFMLLGFISMDMVYVAVAVNYGAQCQLLIFLIRGLNERIEEKSISLQQAIRDYHSAGNYIDGLARQLAIAMSLVEIIVIVQAVVSFVSLYEVKKSSASSTTEALFFAAGVMYVILWCAIALVAFVQASRLNAAYSSTVRVSLDVRLFGYQDASQEEIDSFIVYMSSHGQDRRARLFRVPIYSSYLWAAFAFVVTLLLTLVQLDVLQFTMHL